MISTQRQFFELPDDETYLNAAYMTPTPMVVAEAGEKGIRQKMNPTSIGKEAFFSTPDEVRSLFSQLINNPEPNRIALFPSVSYGMANVVKNIKPGYGNEVLIVEDQFPSAVFPWHQPDSHHNVKTIPLPDLYKNRGERLTDSIIDAIRDQTAAVCIGTVLWTDGTRYHLKRIAEKCQQHGTLLILDGTQSIGALKFDLQEIKPDALICAGYKWLMGPYGMTVGYFGPAFDEGNPIEENWINRQNSKDFTRLTQYEEKYGPNAQRYNSGQYSNFIHIAMLRKSLELILEWKVDIIQGYCDYLTAELFDTITKSKSYWIEKDPNYRSSHIVGIHLLKTELKEKLERTFADKNIHVSMRSDCVRVSPHLYNTKKDMYQFMDVILGLDS
ncbi:aminotransferase class V-fold PLP-dependent enzyme [Membranicola marinus]|uniref:Aminotransferase class V-fold PLP-dependent enzyme n=1 Tax=Membranihabitans marinus TaxID=1227546 RepID=A0A953HVG7_9BACT|nr:aminotransferase class V-fold PLP-dependent enzyme [Membranihabitans marinus]MBY5958926.1 aminotransferase class V-fold PLP-dependent enzyme [Membranihabitans marinus]